MRTRAAANDAARTGKGHIGARAAGAPPEPAVWPPRVGSGSMRAAPLRFPCGAVSMPLQARGYTKWGHSVIRTTSTVTEFVEYSSNSVYACHASASLITFSIDHCATVAMWINILKS